MKQLANVNCNEVYGKCFQGTPVHLTPISRLRPRPPPNATPAAAVNYLIKLSGCVNELRPALCSVSTASANKKSTGFTLLLMYGKRALFRAEVSRTPLRRLRLVVDTPSARSLAPGVASQLTVKRARKGSARGSSPLGSEEYARSGIRFVIRRSRGCR